MASLQIRTRPFGEITIDDRQILRFPWGLFGFETMEQFALLDSGQPPLYWLQSLDKPDLAFVVMDPQLVRPDYQLDVSPDELSALGFTDSQPDALVLAICTVPGNPRDMTINLQGPLVINRDARLGRQVINTSPSWQVRHRIVDEVAGKRAC